MRRKLIALTLTFSLALAALPALAADVESQFPGVNHYPGYADVREGDWFYQNAVLCYETGLITGSALGFEPYREMTVAEVAAIAARLREAAAGDPIPAAQAGEVWYRRYLDYLAGHGVAVPGDPADAATRGGFLRLLAAVLPEDLLSPINAVTELPDTEDPAVLAFYNAGILTGIDPYGTFAGDRSLTRAEGAAMVSRVVRPGLRLTFTPADYDPYAAAGLAPGTILFESGKTAGEYLPVVLELIAELEDASASAGVAFNWFNTYGEQTFLDYVKETALARLGVTKDQGNAAYRSFDVQVFYSRYLDEKGLGGTVERAYPLPLEADRNA